MKKFDPTVYLKIIRVKPALIFDAGGLLMRMFSAMTVLGIITMLTLCGWSFLFAGSVSSVLALATFLISPRVSKAADEHGQRKVVPIATLISLLGLGFLLIVLQFNLPFWLCYIAALIMGFTPNAQSLTRTRWTFLVETGKLGKEAPDLKTVFAYEGILDDAAYMFGPSLAIALSAIFFPIAGMIFGGFCLLAGCILLLIPRSTEPIVGWQAVEESTMDNSDEKKNVTESSNLNSKDESAISGPILKDNRSMFVISSMVRILFLALLITGAFYSVHDTVLVAIGESINQTSFMSLILLSASFVSIVGSLVFGMLKFKAPLSKQFLACAALYGISYGAMFFASNITTLFIICTGAALFYGPMIITINTLCERSVPGARLTESLTWMNSGYTVGMAIAPLAAGFAVDVLGGWACLKICGCVALCVLLVALIAQPIIKRSTK